MIQIEREKIDRIKANAERKIFVSFKREAVHAHADTGTSFLANLHRHVFHFKVWITVRNNDIEPIYFKHWIKSLYQPSRAVQHDSLSFLDLNNKSCDMLADDLYLQIAQKYPDREVWIEIAEDGENGSFIKYELTRPAQSIVI